MSEAQASISEQAERLEQEAGRWKAWSEALIDEIGRVIVGQHDVIEPLVWALVAGGHVLLEGAPGLGKTLLVRTVAGALGLELRRIQCTPDLMPADIVGTSVLRAVDGGERRFVFEPGPIFAPMVLVDEINRATPRTQSALLEAMQEGRVTVGGTSRALPSPFFVLATQNPIEMEGTYPLPEAQLDRFLLKLFARAPDEEELIEVLERTDAWAELPAQAPVGGADDLLAARRFARTLACARPVLSYAARLVLATHPQHDEAPEIVRRYVRYGASPRGAQALIACARARALGRGELAVGFDDVRAALLPALRHRILLNFEGMAEGLKTDAVLEALLVELDPAPGA